MPLILRGRALRVGEARAGLDESERDRDMIDCAKCATPTDNLAVFPGGVCLDCWAVSPEGRRMPTADELVTMWGGRGRG